jgi:DNA mismatch repair protein MutS2
MQMLRGYTQSPLGRARVEALAPSTDRGWIERQHQLVGELREYLRVGGRFEFGGLSDVSTLVAKSRIQGAALEAGEIRDVLAVVDRAAEWLELALHPPTAMKRPLPAGGSAQYEDQTGEFAQSPWPAVAALSYAIVDFTDLLRTMRNKILPDGSLDDRASPELARIRREIEKQKRHIQESLHGYLKRLSEGGVVQDEVVTIRGERFVIPIKTEQKRRVDGVVHGVSSSGQTVFVEPLETIEQNNELVKLLEDEQEEILRILREMTTRIAQYADAIVVAVETLAELELQFAKARYAQDYACATVSFTERDLALEGARHPILERNFRARGQKVVPLTLELGHADDSGTPQMQLVITGPNTGGKTVTLKTVGLLALMAQAGVPVPADKAAMPLFDAALADIGDYQSIEQNLSTFSAHVTNIDFISRTATAHSLVLLDELGSATDPEEGAALAVAIADHFRKLGAMTIVSTHHTSLKVYAANTPGVINAAVGFNEQTLHPTYELRIGVPGASAGIGIAQQLGLNPDIIAGARAKLTTQAQDVSKFLDRLHEQVRELGAERVKASQREQELKRERERLEREGAKEQRLKLREMEQKLESVLKDFEFHAREAVNAVQDRAASLKLSKDAERRIAKLRREFKEQFNNTVVGHTTGADAGDPNAQPHIVKHVTEGDVVKLKSLGRTGTVKRRFDDDTFEIEIGFMKMRVPRQDIAEVTARASESPVKAARARGISVSLADEDVSAPSELNVIGRTVDEASSEVEKFVDRAFLAGLPRVRIVHGSGMGILRKAIRQMLQKHPNVATVTEPPQNEGGAGATVVEFRE